MSLTKEQTIKLANLLRNIASKLEEKTTDWKDWSIGNLQGIAEILEAQAKEDKLE